MRCYKYLYVGKKARKQRYSIIQGLREGKFQPEVYVITPPQNGNNILEIYSSALLLLPSYRDQDRLILGIAADYWEALEVTRDMVADLYRETGGFNLACWLQDY